MSSFRLGRARLGAGGLDNKTYDKVPTKISFDGPEGKVSWGYQLAPGASRIDCFKLLLDGKTRATGYDDASLNLVVDYGNPNATLALPAGMTPLSISEEYLQCVYGHLMERLARRMLNTFYFTPIRFFITTPGVWSHAAQTATKEAASKAGFGSRAGGTISMISEPEAAANFCLRELGAKDSTDEAKLFEKGDEFVICDAGGGTVDLITYSIVEMFPTLKIKEAVVGSGGKCGSTKVDKAFLRMLREKVGADIFDRWPSKRTGRGSTLMSKFEDAKRDFGAHDDDQLWRVPLGNVPDNEACGIEYGELLLLPTDMEDLFSEAIHKILELINDQIRRSEESGRKSIRSILLVGGSANSNICSMNCRACSTHGALKWYRLHLRLSSWEVPATKLSKACRRSAVVKGAVISGHKCVITSRRLKYHYGMAASQYFQEGVHKEEDAFYDYFTGTKLARGYILWFASRGTEIKNGQKFDIVTDRSFNLKIVSEYTDLFGCLAENAPDRHDHQYVFAIGRYRVEYPNIPLRAFRTKCNKDGQPTAFQISQVIQMQVSSAEIKFIMAYDGKEYGSTTLELD